MITLVLGGARSGKSEVAEQIAARHSRVTYIATGIATDADMAARIEAHRARRSPSWTTVEGADDLPGAIRSGAGAVVVDALGTWVATFPDFAVDADADKLISALTERVGDTIVVSEEVGLGVHPSSEAGRRFRDALGLLNQRVAAVADDVLLVVAGRVLHLDRAT